MDRQSVRKELERAADEGYQKFQEKLLPGIPNILGVRLPKLRELARQAAKMDAESFLHRMKEAARELDAYYEEKMLYGLVIGYAKMDDAARRQWLDAFVPVIDNWGVCDSCCMTYKWMKKQPEYWWAYVNDWTFSGTEYGVRFALVSMLAHFVDEAHLGDILTICGQLSEEGYYAKMAQAWLVSMCFVKFPEQTFAFLQTDEMDSFTHNKSIQKTCESYRVDQAWKERLRALRRKL